MRRGRAHPISRLPAARSPRLPYVGEVLDGYRILEPLGRGGMGAVFRAWDEGLQREVALKMVQPRWVGRPCLWDRLLAEARAMARVRHANVVDVYAFGDFEGLPYFAMELLPGGTLEQRIEVQGPGGIPLEERLRILSGVCHGVAAIHRNLMVHGDIKPSNVLLARDGRVALTDMGLARLLDSPEVDAPGLWGTPAYIAPELAAGEPVPVGLLPLADVYSIGVLAFELLTGRLPFETDDTAEMLALHRAGAPPRPTSVYPALHRAFDGVLLRTLHKDAGQRPRSALELLEALTRAADQSRASGRDPRCRWWSSPARAGAPTGGS